MKDNNKKIFLGVIVVATLIITIVGATFAFFSASGGSANNAVTANATTLANLGFTSSHSKIASNLVPVSSESEYFSRYPGIAASGEHSCLDDVGNEICSIYEFTVTNTASVAQTIYVSFVPSENTFDNMYFAAFNTSIASASYEVATGSNGSGSNFVLTPQTTSGNSTLGHQATKLTKNSTDPIDMSGLSTSLGVGESITYTVLVWLQETKNEQNTEQGGFFKAGINVTTEGNSTGVTGLLDGSYTYVYTVSTTTRASIRETIPNDMVTYSTASSAISAYGHSFALKHKIGNYSGYCSYSMENGIDTGYYDCRFNSQVECESAVQVSEEDDEYTYECRHREVNNAVLESYVVFEVTPEMASANPGMVVGTYELRGGDMDFSYESPSYSTNIDIIKTAFGYNSHPERCVEYADAFSCDVSGLGAFVEDSGEVKATYHSGDVLKWCQVFTYFTSSCGAGK